MHGFFNRILRIDLSDNSHCYDAMDDAVLKSTLGGKGLGVRLLWEQNPRGVDPLAPENMFVMAAGPLTGSGMWGSARFGVFSKSPLTGGYGESFCGGTMPANLKGCGIDAVVISGRCSSLTHLHVDENGVTFCDAEGLAGRDTADTEDHIRAKIHSLRRSSGAEASIMTIGPAGEKLVRFACIKCDRWRSLGRGGMGAVLGSKNVKAISFRGAKKADIADDALLKDVMRLIARKGRESPVTDIYRRFGTPSQVAVTNSMNCFPTRYWEAGHFDEWEKLSAEYMQTSFQVKACGCPSCFLRCTKHSVVRNGRHRGLELEGPEYETIYAIGGLNEISSLEEVAYLNDLCDRLGMDTMSAGNIAGFAVEARKRGKSDFAIDYGDPDKMAELFTLIARREGIGDLLAEGIRPAAAELGLEDLAVHVKGMEPAGFDPRVLKGMGLSYATAARGACHLRGTFYKAELSGQVDKDAVAGKAEAVIDYEDRAALFDCLILCRFFRDFILWDELARLIEASTGMRMSKPQLELLANRVTQNTRRYNIREGLSEETDTLPERLLREPTREGSKLEPEDLALMVREYNTIRRSRDAEKSAESTV